MKDNTKETQLPTLLQAIMELLEAQRPAFKQWQPYWRGMGLGLAELFSFGRHTIVQGIVSLGQTQGDWSGGYRLLSRERWAEARLSRILVRERLRDVAATEPYGVGIDSSQMRRSSLKLAGTSGLKSPAWPAFRPGIEQAQRFLTGVWQPPVDNGFSRAIPFRFMTAFPQSVPTQEPARREWEAGLAYLSWIRAEPNQARGSEGF